MHTDSKETRRMIQHLSGTGPRTRAALALLCACLLLPAQGCSWFRGKTDYASSPQTRPLEVPPDLDAPIVDPARQVPDVAPVAAGGSRSVAVPTAADEILLQDTVDSAYRRLGLALERTDGVTVEDRAELLSVYTVRYQGESFILRVQPGQGGGSRISAVAEDGTPLAGGASAALLGVLRLRLG